MWSNRRTLYFAEQSTNLHLILPFQLHVPLNYAHECLYLGPNRLVGCRGRLWLWVCWQGLGLGESMRLWLGVNCCLDILYVICGDGRHRLVTMILILYVTRWCVPPVSFRQNRSDTLWFQVIALGLPEQLCHPGEDVTPHLIGRCCLWLRVCLPLATDGADLSQLIICHLSTSDIWPDFVMMEQTGRNVHDVPPPRNLRILPYLHLLRPQPRSRRRHLGTPRLR